MFLMIGGRGTGKTDGAARYVIDHVAGPACDRRLPGGHRVAIIAPTLGDAVESCVTGPSGLKAHDPTVRMVGGVGGTFVRWPSGAEGKLFGAHTPEDRERLRSGGNRCLVWMEELAAQRYLADALDHARFGLRIGPRPHFVGSTTPRPKPAVKALLADVRTLVTRGKTRDAVHLDTTVRDDLLARYGGTRLGRQELDGELLEDTPGALWTLQVLDDSRVTPEQVPDLKRVVVAIDPAVTSGDDSDLTGIMVVGQGVDGDAYVLADLSCRDTPDGWARRAVAAYDKWNADTIVAEVNNGGDLVQSVIATVDRRARYRAVRASRGKRTRAEPVAALWEQGRAHLVGSHPELEDQLITWTPDSGSSPDRLDALVWGVTETALQVRRGHVSVAS
jgi:phage terminase large subunit-like protein